MFRRFFYGLILVCMIILPMVACDCGNGPPELCAGVECGAGQVCSGGQCVDKCDKTLCGGLCVDLKTDAKHCGQCDKACGTGQKCDKGLCTASCEGNEVVCKGSCVDTQTNKQHCGRCGSTCRSGEACKKGKCELDCSDGTVNCNEKCVNTQSDNKNCGKCGEACKAGQLCRAGKCELNCADSQTVCSGQCVYTQSNRAHCGGCGKACKAGFVCSQGKCELSCQESLTDCSGSCVNLKINVSHCGGCGKVCQKGQICRDGACDCPSGVTNCSGVCTNLQTDPANCGQCGKLCKTNEICVKGACGVSCKNGETNCGNACFDLLTSNKHCGACSQACANGSGCCQGACTDLRTSSNCGRCGNACKGGKACTQGACKCPAGSTECGGQCVDLLCDVNHCGACGKVCSKGSICKQGKCGPPWAAAIGGITKVSFDNASAMTQDSSGNLYVAGTFRGSKLVLGSFTLTGPTPINIFVMKLNSNLAVQWVLSVSSTSSLDVNSIALGRGGEVYVAGSYYSSVKFGTTTLTSKGSAEIYLAKVSSSGKSWSWAKSFGGSSADRCTALATDSSGNIYMSGSFSSTVSFGSGQTARSRGRADVFVAKISSSGTTTWVATGGGSSSDSGYGLGVDSAGNVYVAGSFYIFTTAVTFGSGQGQIIYRTTRRFTEAFVAKLNSSGQWQWVTTGGGNGTDYANGIAVDRSGNSYVVGRFYAYSSSFATFGSGTNTFRLKSMGSRNSSDVFVGKIDTKGVWQWVKSAGSLTYSDAGQTIALDRSNNVYISGLYRTSTSATSFAKFGSFSLKSSGENSDIFVAKLSNSGVWQWATSVGGSGGYKDARGVVLDGSGNVYIAGALSGEDVKFGTTTLKGGPDSDIFVGKLTASGTPSAGKRYAGSSSLRDRARDIVSDREGNLYVIGAYRGVANFGTTKLTSTKNSSDIFVAKLSKCGEWAWAVSAGGLGDAEGRGIAVDSSSNVYITGFFGPLDRGGERSRRISVLGTNEAAFGSFTLKNVGRDDVFVASLDKNGKWRWAKSAGSRSSDESYSIAVDSSANVYITGHFGASGATFGTTTMTYRSGGEIFVSKLSSQGAWLWTKQALGTGTDRSRVVRLDSKGDAYIAGYYSRTINFGSTTLSVTNSAFFVAKIDKNGVWKWAKGGSGTVSSLADSLALDSGDNLFVTGTFYGSVNIGGTTLTPAGSGDVFVALMDKSGAWKWAQRGGGTSGDTAFQIVVDSKDNAYLTGEFRSNATFGKTTLSQPVNSRTVYVASISKTGNWIGAVASTSNNSQGNSGGYSLVVTSDNKLYVVGEFSGAVKFGSNSLTSKGESDVFLWQMLLPLVKTSP